MNITEHTNGNTVLAINLVDIHPSLGLLHNSDGLDYSPAIYKYINDADQDDCYNYDLDAIKAELSGYYNTGATAVQILCSMINMTMDTRPILQYIATKILSKSDYKLLKQMLVHGSVDGKSTEALLGRYPRVSDDAVASESKLLEF